MVAHLMRNKKDSALGVKFVRKSFWKPDQITNMEGALHTFVTPLVDITMHGDYQWRARHSVHRFGSAGAFQLGRRVILSALIQQDFEDDDVMFRVARLDEEEVIGALGLPRILEVEGKQDDAARRSYNSRIREYLVYHLVASRQLPAAETVRDYTMTISGTLDFLRDVIKRPTAKDLQAQMQLRFFHCNRQILSLELMFNTALHQIMNEFGLLEQRCAKQGYVYTFNPPAIFARFLGPDGTELLTRIHIAALKYFASVHPLNACHCVAWDDFSSPGITDLLRHAVSGHHITVKRMADLFPKDRGIKQERGEGLYVPPNGAEDAMLVIHNNSDAFGQNIETEPFGGSLDGVIGACSSAAGSLMRHRKDLCDDLVRIGPIS
jgi:hypothetical protein